MAFICLLRSDEVLKIRCENLEFVEGENPHFILTLPFRKTHQHGGKSKLDSLATSLLKGSFAEIKPFYLYAMGEEDAHLCPVRALAEWLAISKITLGYLFRKIVSGERVSATDTPLVSQSYSFQGHWKY